MFIALVIIVIWMTLALVPPIPPAMLAPVMFVLGPIVMYRLPGYRRNGTIEPFDNTPNTESGFDPGLLKEFDQACAGLETAGYSLLGRWIIRDYTPSATLLRSVFRHDQDQLDAAVTVVRVNTGPYRGHPIVELKTAFADNGSGPMSITTSNSTILSSYSDPRRVALRREGLTDVRELHRLHMLMVQHFATSPRKPLDSRNAVPAAMHQEMLADLDRTAAHGHMRLGPDGVYSRTIKGACRTAWTMMWPVLPIRKALDHYRNTRLLHEIGA